eukprot:Rmarinus@m.11114
MNHLHETISIVERVHPIDPTLQDVLQAFETVCKNNGIKREENVRLYSEILRAASNRGDLLVSLRRLAGPAGGYNQKSSFVSTSNKQLSTASNTIGVGVDLDATGTQTTPRQTGFSPISSLSHNGIPMYYPPPSDPRLPSQASGQRPLDLSQSLLPPTMDLSLSHIGGDPVRSLLQPPVPPHALSHAGLPQYSNLSYSHIAARTPTANLTENTDISSLAPYNKSTQPSSIRQKRKGLLLYRNADQIHGGFPNSDAHHVKVQQDNEAQRSFGSNSGGFLSENIHPSSQASTQADHHQVAISNMQLADAPRSDEQCFHGQPYFGQGFQCAQEAMFGSNEGSGFQLMGGQQGPASHFDHGRPISPARTIAETIVGAGGYPVVERGGLTVQDANDKIWNQPAMVSLSSHRTNYDSLHDNNFGDPDSVGREPPGILQTPLEQPFEQAVPVLQTAGLSKEEIIHRWLSAVEFATNKILERYFFRWYSLVQAHGRPSPLPTRPLSGSGRSLTPRALGPTSNRMRSMSMPALNRSASGDIQQSQSSPSPAPLLHGIGPDIVSPQSGHSVPTMPRGVDASTLQRRAAFAAAHGRVPRAIPSPSHSPGGPDSRQPNVILNPDPRSPMQSLPSHTPSPASPSHPLLSMPTSPANSGASTPRLPLLLTAPPDLLKSNKSRSPSQFSQGSFASTPRLDSSAASFHSGSPPSVTGQPFTGSSSTSPRSTPSPSQASRTSTPRLGSMSPLVLSRGGSPSASQNSMVPLNLSSPRLRARSISASTLASTPRLISKSPPPTLHPTARSRPSPILIPEDSTVTRDRSASFVSLPGAISTPIPLPSPRLSPVSVSTAARNASCDAPSSHRSPDRHSSPSSSSRPSSPRTPPSPAAHPSPASPPNTTGSNYRQDYGPRVSFYVKTPGSVSSHDLRKTVLQKSSNEWLERTPVSARAQPSPPSEADLSTRLEYAEPCHSGSSSSLSEEESGQGLSLSASVPPQSFRRPQSIGAAAGPGPNPHAYRAFVASLLRWVRLCFPGIVPDVCAFRSDQVPAGEGFSAAKLAGALAAERGHLYRAYFTKWKAYCRTVTHELYDWHTHSQVFLSLRRWRRYVVMHRMSVYFLYLRKYTQRQRLIRWWYQSLRNFRIRRAFRRWTSLYHTRLCCRPAFNSWRKHTARSLVVARRAGVLHRRHVMRAAFRTWEDNVEFWLRYMKFREVSLARFQRLMIHRLRSMISLKKRLDQIGRRIAMGLLWRAFQHWRDITRHGAVLRASMMFYAWREYTLVLRLEVKTLRNADAVHRLWLLRRALRGWASWSVHRRWVYSVAFALRARVTYRRAQWALGTMLQKFQRIQYMNDVADQIILNKDAETVCRIFKSWMRTALAQHRERVFTLRCNLFHDGRLLAKTFTAWHLTARRSAQRRDLEARLSQIRQEHTWRKWKSRFGEVVCDRRAQKKAKVFDAWRSAWRWGRVMDVFTEVYSLRFFLWRWRYKVHVAWWMRTMRMGKAFRGWCRHFYRRRALCSVLDTRALERRHVVALRTIDAWRAYVRRRHVVARFERRLRIVYDACLSEWIWEMWCFGHAVSRLMRRVHASRLRPFFAGWSDLVSRLDDDREGRLHTGRCRRVSRVLHVWMMVAKGRRECRDRRSLARALAARTALDRYWSSWRSFLFVARAERKVRAFRASRVLRPMFLRWRCSAVLFWRQRQVEKRLLLLRDTKLLRRSYEAWTVVCHRTRLLKFAILRRLRVYLMAWWDLVSLRHRARVFAMARRAALLQLSLRFLCVNSRSEQAKRRQRWVLAQECFREWQVLTVADGFRRMRLLRAALCSLSRLATGCIRRRSLARFSAFQRSRKLTSRVFVVLLRFVLGRKMGCIALARRMLRKWSTVALQMLHKRMVTRYMQAVHKTSLLKASWNHWYDRWQRLEASRVFGRLRVMRHAWGHWRRAVVVASHEWTAVTQLASRLATSQTFTKCPLRFVCVLALRRWRNYGVWRALRQWVGYCLYRKRTILMGEKAVVARLRFYKRHAWCAWRRLYQSTALVRSANKFREHYLALNTICLWRRAMYFQWGIKRFQVFALHLTLGRAMKCWRRAVSRGKRAVKRALRLPHVRAMKMVKVVLQRWRFYGAYCKRRRIAMRMRRENLLRIAMGSWLGYARRKVRVRLLGAIASGTRFLESRFFRTWRRAFTDKIATDPAPSQPANLQQI